MVAPSREVLTHSLIQGRSPSISANGTAYGIVWAAENGTPAVLHAYDASDLSRELYNTNQAPNSRDHFGDRAKFSVPTVANGKVYVATTGGTVGGFGLFNPPRLTNLSGQAYVGLGDRVLIGGFRSPWRRIETGSVPGAGAIAARQWRSAHWEITKSHGGVARRKRRAHCQQR